MTRRTGSVTLLPVLLLFAAVLLPAGPSTAAAAGPLGCTHGWDYGDAPLRYRTVRAQRGPRHLITRAGALTLGTTVTADGDGRPDDGDVDDALGTPVRISASAPRVTVTVHNTSRSTALLAGWLDTSGDGFAARERAVVRVPVGATRATLRWTPPAGTGTGAGQLRLRLYQGLPLHPVPVGAAVGGEVEDYRVTFAGPPTTPAPTPSGAVPAPRPTKASPRPAPSRSARAATTPAGPTPTPDRSTPPTSTPPPTTQASRSSSPPARPVTRAEPPRPRRGGLPLTWSIALLIVAPAAAAAAHAVGRAARRRH